MFPWNLFPFNENFKNRLKYLKPNEIEKFTQEVMENMLSTQMEGVMNPQNALKGIFPNANNYYYPNQNPSLDLSIFETHDYIYVRVPIKSEDWLQQIKIYHTSNLITIEHIPKIDDKHTFTLPAIVRRKGVTANFKDETLEIKLPKSVDMQFSEIDVRNS